MMCRLNFAPPQNQGCSSQGEDIAFFYADTFFGPQQFVHQESAGDAVVVPQGIHDLSLLVAFDIQDAVATVHTGIVAFDGNIGFRTFGTPSDNIVSFMQGENLFEGKNVFNDDNVSPVLGSFLFVDDFFPATACVQFGFPDPDAKLLLQLSQMNTRDWPS